MTKIDRNFAKGADRTMRPATVAVWDRAVLVFHWALVGTMGYEFVAEAGTAWHENLGYGLLGLLGFRLIWGFVGTRYARFRQFVVGPRAALAYVRAIKQGHPARYIGHNPAGAVMVLGLMVMIAATAGTGWAMTTDALWGTAWIEILHRVCAYATLAMIVAHVGGVVLASVQHRENLVFAMITGAKRRE